MRFAFIIMGEFNFPTDRAEIGGGNAQIIGVADMNGALEAARMLQKSGVDCIELCGAFGEDGARKIIEATGNGMPIGYVNHLPEQDGLYRVVFSER